MKSVYYCLAYKVVAYKSYVYISSCIAYSEIFWSSTFLSFILIFLLFFGDFEAHYAFGIYSFKKDCESKSFQFKEKESKIVGNWPISKIAVGIVLSIAVFRLKSNGIESSNNQFKSGSLFIVAWIVLKRNAENPRCPDELARYPDENLVCLISEHSFNQWITHWNNYKVAR